MNVIERALLDHRDELGLAALGLDDRLQTALLTPRFVTSRHVVAMVFAEGDPRPRAIAKIPRMPGDDAGVATEARILRRLASLSGTAVPGVPVVLGTTEVGGRMMLVETAVSGAPFGQAQVVRDLDRAVAAGARFAANLPQVLSPSENTGWYDDVLRAPLDRLSRQIGREADVAELCARTHTVLAPLRRVPLPAVIEHGDLSFPNLFFAEDTGELLVIDWERANDRGLPGHDLIFFLQFLSQCLHGFATPEEQIGAFDRAFVGVGAWARPVLDQHLAGSGVHPELSGLLIVASWARTAATLADRLGAHPETDHGDAAAVAMLAERDVTLWRHALDRAEDGGLLFRG